MVRLNSFYLSPEKWHEPYVIEDGEAHHMLKVLRTPVGETVRLFDGDGHCGLFRLSEATKSKAVLTLESQSREEDRRGLTLAVGWNKSSRRGWILEKAVELEARSIIFFQAEHSQGRIPEKGKEKWNEALISAAKQCGNTWLPTIETASGGIKGVVQHAAGFEHRLVLWEKQSKESLLDPSKYDKGHSIVVIGPEGGLSENEISILKNADFNPLSLGSSILRWETAALLCMSAFYLERQKNSDYR